MTPTLNQVLANNGYRTEPGECGASSVIRVATDEHVYSGRTVEVWHWLRRQGHVVEPCVVASGGARCPYCEAAK